MTDYRDTDFYQELTRTQGARSPATIGEVWQAEWQRTGLDTIGGVGRPFGEAVDELATAIERESGTDIASYAHDKRVPLGSAVTVDHRVALLNQLADTLPEENRKRIDPLRDARKRASDKAQEIERNASDVSGATYGVGGHVVSFMAGIARQTVDPVNIVANIATAPLGGPFKGPLLAVMARQGIASAAAQAAVEPYIEATRAELGLEHGVGRAMFNIGEAGLGGAGLAGLFRGAAFGMRVISRAARGPHIEAPGLVDPTAPPAARPGAPGETAPATHAGQPTESLREFYGRIRDDIGPEDLEAMAKLAERDQLVTDARPGIEDGPRIDAAADALELGKPVTTVEPLDVKLTDAPYSILVGPGGRRIQVRDAIVELRDLIKSHDRDGNPVPNYPAELQPRDRKAPASRTWVAEKSAALEPELLGEAPTAGMGAPVVGPDGVVEIGNGRALLLEAVYDRHPERATAYKASLEQRGFDITGMQEPVRVRMREGELSMAERAQIAVESNVSHTAGMSTRERAAVDAKAVDSELMALWRGGDVTAAKNAPFVRGFADRVVAAEERTDFIGGDNGLSQQGVQRIEAALVQRAWGATDIVTALYEVADPSSRAIIGAMADTAPEVARLKAAIEAGRIPPEADPTPAMLDGYRLVERARGMGERVKNVVEQIDIEHGAVPQPVAEATRLYFRDDALRQAAGRDVVASRINKAVEKALEHENALADLFGVKPDAVNALRAGKLEGVPLEELPAVPENARIPGEADKQYAKRVIDVREAPAALPEDHAQYFKIDADTKIVPIENLVSSKTDTENAKGAANGAKRMAAAAAGEIDRRVPITVTPIAGGKFLVLDGNGTMASVARYEWKALPVKVIEPLFPPGASNGVVARHTIEGKAFDERRLALQAQQPYATVDAGMAMAQRHQPPFVKDLEAVGIGEIHDTEPKKNVERIEQKIREKYAGDVRGMTDLARAGVTITSPEQADRIVLKLGEKYRVIDEGWKVSDVGYIDRKLEVVTADGMFIELQIWPPAVRAAKSEGEVMYKARREAPPAAREAMKELEIAYWAEVHRQLDEEWSVTVMGGSPYSSRGSLNRLRASASVSSSPSQVTSASLTEIHPVAPTEKASNPSTTARVLPHLNQRGAISEPPPKDIGIPAAPVEAAAAAAEPMVTPAAAAPELIAAFRGPKSHQQFKAWEAENVVGERDIIERKTFPLPDGTMKTADLRRTVYELKDGRTVEIKQTPVFEGVSGRSTTTYEVVPARPEAEAPAAPAPAAKAKPLGDPIKAQEFERVLEELGGDYEIVNADGTKVSARAAIEQAQADARAAAELEACIGEAALEAA